MTIAFWLCVGVLAYGYVGFPALLALAGLLLNRGVRKGAVTPSVSVIVAAHNEEEAIAARVRNLLSTNYPAERLEVVVASDGSTDGTVRRATASATDRVRVLDLPRVGKAGALAEGVRRASGDILVFTDANTMFRPDAIRALTSNFADPDVGGVAGHTGYVVPEEGEASGRGEDLYWRYDSWLKTLQTRTGSVISAHGGMYAIRRELFRPVEDPAVTDDFAISTGVVAQGRRLVFEPGAVGHEQTMERSGTEFRRRVRLMTRGVQGVVLRRGLLNPFRYGFYAVVFFSHKVLRRLLPLTLPVLLVSSIVLAARGAGTVYVLAAAAQSMLYLLAIVGWALKRSPLGRRALFFAPFFFCLANAAAVLALWNVARGRRIERWSPHRHVDGASRTEATAPDPPSRSQGIGQPALGLPRSGETR